MTDTPNAAPAPDAAPKKIGWRFIPETLLYTAIFLFAQLVVSLLICLPYSLALISGALTENVSINEATRILTEKLYTEFLPTYTPIISIASTVLGLGVLFLILRKTDAHVFGNLGFTRPEKNAVVYTVPLGLGLQIFFSLVIGTILALPGMEETLRRMTEYSAALEGPDRLLSAFALVVAAPVNEELFFRGAIMRSMEKSALSPVAAVVIQALLFGVFHELPLRMLYAFLLGLILGLLRVKSRSILPCLVLHAVFNCCAYWEELFTVVSPAAVIVLLILSALVVAVSLWLIMRKKESPDEA